MHTKNGGCDHMTCTMCRHKFCWICEKDWELGLDHSKCWDKRREMNKLERRSVVDNVRLADEETLEARKFRLAFEQFNRYERKQKCAENQLNGVMEPQLISSYEQLIECRKVLKMHMYLCIYTTKVNVEEMVQLKQRIRSNLTLETILAC